jgi:hypothetical protein
MTSKLRDAASRQHRFSGACGCVCWRNASMPSALGLTGEEPAHGHAGHKQFVNEMHCCSLARLRALQRFTEMTSQGGGRRQHLQAESMRPRPRVVQRNIWIGRLVTMCRWPALVESV